MTKLNEFKKKLYYRHTIAVFRDPLELAVRVAMDLSRALRERVLAEQDSRRKDGAIGWNLGTPSEQPTQADVGTCLLVGDAWQGIASSVRAGNWTYRFFEGDLDDESLSGVKVLIVPGPGFRGTRQFTTTKRLLRAFV